MIPEGVMKAVNAVRGVLGSDNNPFVRMGEKLYDVTHPPTHTSVIFDQPVTQKPTMTPTPSPTATPTPTPAPTAVPQKILPTQPAKVNDAVRPEYAQFLENSIFPITRKFNIPDAVAASQWAVEGGRVTGNKQNNPWGLMRNNAIINYPDLESSTRDYALTVQNILKTKGIDVSNSDAFDVLMALQKGDRPRYEAHNPDPYTYVKTLINTPEWRSYYK